MLKNVSRLEWKIGEKNYHFTCETDSSLTDVKESLCQFLKYVGLIEDRVKAAQAEKQEETPVDPSQQETPKD